MVGNRSKERDRKSELVLGSTYQIFEWNRNNADRNFHFRETNRIAADNFPEKYETSPFPLVPRGPLGPLMFPSCQAGSNRSKDLAGTDIAKRSWWKLVFATVRASVHTEHMPHIMIVNRLEANKEHFRPDRFDQTRPHCIRSLQFDQQVRPLSFRPEKFDLFTATREDRQVTSQFNCLPSSQGARVIPSGRFHSVGVRPFGSKIERILIKLSACFTKVLKFWCLEKDTGQFAEK